MSLPQRFTPGTANLRVLLIDDSLHFLTAAADFLRQQSGLQVIGAVTTGTDALLRVQQDPADVILLDVFLENQSGISLISPIRAILPKAKIIVLSSDDKSGYDTVALQAGADAFLSKQESTRTLVPAIFEVSGQRPPDVLTKQFEPGPGQIMLGDLISASHDLFYRYELLPQRGYAFINAAAKTQTGYAPEEYYADPDLWWKLIHPGDRLLFDQLKHDISSVAKPVAFRLIRKDGSTAHVEHTGVVVRDADGRLVALEGVVRAVVRPDQADDASFRTLNVTHGATRTGLEGDAVIEAWVYAAELREGMSIGRAQRVADVTVELARAWGVDAPELVHIRRGALLHDIGKQAISERILHRQSALSQEETHILRTHPQLARDLLISVDGLAPALDIPYGHHENWDGSGYPRGLKGTEIPLAARLFSVVDAWHELRTMHARHPDWTAERIAAELRSLGGTRLDLVIVDFFLQRLAEGGLEAPHV